MRILVTGGAGFIGFYLAKKLSEKDEVVVVDNLSDYYDVKLKEARLEQIKDRVEFHKIDISDLSSLKKIFEKYEFDLICHIAAQAGVRYSLINPWIYEKSNILGTLNIFELTKKFNIKKVIYASSSSVYGGNKKVPFSEEDKVDKPISLYAATKIDNELMAHTYHYLYKIDMIGLRYFTVYGPFGRPDMAMFKFTKNIFEDKPIEVYNFGNMKRDFTYIDDIIDGTIKAINFCLNNNDICEIINLGNSKPIELNYFIKLLEKEIGKEAKKNLLSLQPGDVLETYADITKAKKILGWEPKTEIEEGVKKFVEWYRDYYGK
ncbi:MAG: protein CapI [Candidatus Aenigmatarchaeota archaeon]|nr:MAG: protein CapI [Candidatus Aenigmarchaeota archaeon]